MTAGASRSGSRRAAATPHEGRRLHGPPRGAPTRPTPDRVREALFSILGGVEGAAVVDLFAGTGALGIEALSRGAARAAFVERDRSMLRILGQNLQELGMQDRALVLGRDVFDALAGPLRSAAPWDLVLADPPYADGQHARLLEAVAEVLSPGALVVLEHAARTPPPETAVLVLDDTRTWGDTAVTFYRPRSSADRRPTEGSGGLQSAGGEGGPREARGGGAASPGRQCDTAVSFFHTLVQARP